MATDEAFDDFIEQQNETPSTSHVEENGVQNEKKINKEPKFSISSVDTLVLTSDKKNSGEPPGISNDILKEEGFSFDSSKEKNNSTAEIAEEPSPESIAAKRRFRKELCGKASLIIISRLLYTLHVLLTIWRISAVLGNKFWYMACWIVTFLIESIVVIVVRKGKEWTWFQPIVMLYLMVELPGIWLLELEKASAVQDSFNRSIILDGIYGTGAEVTKFKVNSVNVRISSSTWALLLEQSMLVLIIAARWLMPKGELTKEQLSGLLLSYLGTASDAVDFFSVLAEEPKLLLKLGYLFTILSVWSWSMFQFMFVVTMTVHDDECTDSIQGIDNKIAPDIENGIGIPGKGSNPEINNERPKTASSLGKLSKKRSTCRAFVESEIWSIFVSVVLQDGPYVIVRLTCVFYWSIRTYTNYFFTAKNCMMLALQIYRIIGVYQKESSEPSQKDKLGKVA